MRTVTALRRLWRLRKLVLASAVVALLAGLLIPYHVGFPPERRQHHLGIASASALVDTSTSQVADLGRDAGTDVATLAARASLLASLMTKSPIKDEIARGAGVPRGLLVATPPATVGPAASPSPAVRDASVTASDPKAYVLRTTIPTVESGQMPLISVETQAPDAARASRLADVSLAVLKAHVESVAGVDKVPGARRLVVRELGPASATTVAHGPRPLYGLLAAIGVFALACGLLVGGSSVAAAWRRADDAEACWYDPANITDPVSSPSNASPERAQDDDDGNRNRNGVGSTPSAHSDATVIDGGSRG